ncbi:MAG TPA: hypothetical protein VFX25_01765 [Streptosporangiaceae bacterium]|nr:hypothetical protein [Streptosporangiaceae bacterium]
MSIAVGCRDDYQPRLGIAVALIASSWNLRLTALLAYRQHRAVAARYDKGDFTWRGTVDVASIRIWLRRPVP